MQNKIFSTASPKAIKASKFGYLNAIHYMAPYTLAGVGNLCPHASEGCKALCLGEHSGQAGMVKNDTDMNSVRLSRRAKAQRFMRDRVNYMRDVVRSIELEAARAARKGMKLCVRMNGSADIAFEGVSCERNGVKHRNVFEAFADVQFVDYTKNPRRFARELPANYHLTFSRSETNETAARNLLLTGVNVAVVFAGDKPVFWNGFITIDGDEHDLRHLDPRAAEGSPGYVVALTPKGRKAKRDTSGFVVR
jgi:hypothetical protein